MILSELVSVCVHLGDDTVKMVSVKFDSIVFKWTICRSILSKGAHGVAAKFGLNNSMPVDWCSFSLLYQFNLSIYSTENILRHGISHTSRYEVADCFFFSLLFFARLVIPFNQMIKLKINDFCVVHACIWFLQLQIAVQCNVLHLLF